MAPVGVQTYPNRPSRLLNLNRSFLPHKRITAANADSSQFLKLPQELRCRIYDYVFGSNLVRINPCLTIEQKSKRVGYTISMCTCEHDHTQLSPRVRGYDHETEPERVCTKPCQHCTVSSGPQQSACEAFSLPLLQVCRQIYHEAALKPFQQALFIFDFDKLQMADAGYGVPAFVNALVPAQVKALTSLRLLSASRTNLNSAKLPRLQGLKHLEMRLDCSFKHFDYVLQQLENFATDPNVRSLVKLNLKSIHIEIGVDGPNFRHRILAELTGKPLRSPTEDDAKIFEEILKRTETDLVESGLKGSS